jgi:hypothetical protein
MGCFDGTDGLTEDGSTAQIAKWLGAPVPSRSPGHSEGTVTDILV